MPYHIQNEIYQHSQFKPASPQPTQQTKAHRNPNQKQFVTLNNKSSILMLNGIAMPPCLIYAAHMTSTLFKASSFMFDLIKKQA